MEKLPQDIKQCSMCKHNKSLDDFKIEYKNCNKCLEIRKLSYQRHKEEIQQKQREYYTENREIILNREKEYRARNREQVLQQKKEYRERNKDKIKEARKLYYDENRETILKKQREKLAMKKELSLNLNEMD